VRERYLALPEGIPDRVYELAAELTAGQPTVFDQALALEAYLRTFPYTLDLPPPPPDRDIVDYFLFDLKRGYCDYYATSLVVLARAVGIPARLAVGYASGFYDPANQRQIVTAADAHSWVEVYFPEYGWVPFEPTAGQPPLVRPADPQDIQLTTETDLAPFASRQERILQFISLGLVSLVGVLVVGFVAWNGIEYWRLAALPPERFYPDVFSKIYLAARRLQVPFGRGDTPLQFSARFAHWLRVRFAGSRQEHNFTRAGVELERITQIYITAQYSPEMPAAEQMEDVLTAWRWLRRQFLVARLQTWIRRKSE
jgi:hypothetical protein